MTSSWRPFVVTAVAVFVGAIACTQNGPRPCRRDDQCEDGDRCVIPAGDEVGVCARGPDGEGEGEGEGEVEPGFALDVQAGGLFACAIDNNARVQCWGSNGRGQLGRVTDGGVDEVPAPIPGLSDVDTLAVGNTHACALGRLGADARDLVCWGDNGGGTLGDGPRVVAIGELVTPLPAGLGFEATSIDADGDNQGGITCVATAGGVRCFGPLVAGTDGGRPVPFGTLDGAVRVSVATDVVCGFDGADVATCVRPGAVPGVASTTAAFGCAPESPCPPLDGGRVFATEIDVGCRLVNGDVHCGGDNTYGVVNPADRATGLASERLVKAGVVDVGVGIHHACAVGLDGAVVCWGHAIAGATGAVVTGQDPGPSVPCATVEARCQAIETVALPPGVEADVVAISTHHTLSCVRDDNGAVACWGTLGRAVEGMAPTHFPMAP